MGNIIEYIQWRGDIPFSVIPPGEVDELIFSHLAYLDLSETGAKNGVLLSDAYFAWKRKGLKCPAGIHSGFLWNEIIPMFRMLAYTKRYGNCVLSGYESQNDAEAESQFGAMILEIPEMLEKHIVFRGTDDTLIGWKENLRMSYEAPIPAQKSAIAYLTRYANTGSWILNGHSKGGNLAVYAASSVPDAIRKRIISIWNFDGPGFRPEFFKADGYRAISAKIRMYVPESSVFGMMLFNDGKYHVVNSQGKGVGQHDGFTWVISGGGFRYADCLSPKSRLLHRAINCWLSGVCDEDRKRLTSCLFRMLSEERFNSMSEVRAKENRARVLHAYFASDRETKRFVWKTLLPLIRLWRSVEIATKKKQVIPKTKVSVPGLSLGTGGNPAET